MPLRFARCFVRQHRKLPAEIRSKVDERLRLFVRDQSHVSLNNHALRGEWLGCRSINITGDYRAIYEPCPNEAHFIAVGTHHELYGN
jgi:addiction module RelE/StbE family toxin